MVIPAESNPLQPNMDTFEMLMATVPGNPVKLHGKCEGWDTSGWSKSPKAGCFRQTATTMWVMHPPAVAMLPAFESAYTSAQL